MPGEKRDVSILYDKTPKHIAIPIFNRATYCRALNFIEACEKSEVITYTLILSGALIEEGFGGTYLKKKNTVKIETNSNSNDVGSVSSNILLLFSRHFSGNSYDAVVVTADRFETLPVTYAALLNNLPIIHFQGGEVTGNIDERVRHAVTKMADYHFCSTKQSKKYIEALGEDYWRIWHTGCPSLDVIRRNNIQRIETKDRYYIAMFHPHTDDLEESYEQAKIMLEACLVYSRKYSSVCNLYMPNPDSGREALVELFEKYTKDHGEYFRKSKNQEPVKFLKELARAKFIIGNSSCGLRESSFLGLPSINIGSRQSMRERSWNVIDLPKPTLDETIDAIEYQHNIGKYKKSYLYGFGRAGEYAVAKLEGLEISRKGPILYPMRAEFWKDHFGKERHEKHKIWRRDGDIRRTP